MVIGTDKESEIREKWVYLICIWKVNLTGLVIAMELGDRRQG